MTRFLSNVKPILLEAELDDVGESIEKTVTFMGTIKEKLTDPETYMVLLGIVFNVVLVIILARVLQAVGMKMIDIWVKKDPDSRKQKTISNVFGSALKFVITFFMITGVLEAIGVPTTSVLAVAGVGSVAIGFGAQALVTDVITGMFSIMEDYFGVGDIVEINGKTGVVESVGLRTMTIRSVNGDLHIIPHGQIQMVTNMSKDFKRALIDFDLPYDTEPDEVIEKLQKVMDTYDGEGKTMGQPMVQGVVNFNESGYVLRVICDCKIGEHVAVERDFRKIILDFLNEENLEIPFTTRAIQVEFEDIDILKEIKQ